MENPVSPGGQELLGELASQMNGFTPITVNLIHHETASLGVGYDAGQAKSLGTQFGVTRDRNLAAPIQAGIEGSLSENAICGIQMMQGPNQILYRTVGYPTFDADCPLSNGRERDPGTQGFGNAIPKTQPLQAGGCQNDGIESLGFELFKSGTDITAERGDAGVRKFLPDLSLPSQTRGSDAGIGGQCLERRVPD